MKKITKIITVLLIGAMVFSMAACGGSASDSAKQAYFNEAPAAANESAVEYEPYDYGYENDVYAEETSENGSGNESAPVQDTSRKLIKTFNMSVETEEFDAFMDFIQNKVTEMGGYIESMSVNNGSKYGGYGGMKNSYMTIRIPASRVDGFMTLLGEKANIVSQNLNVEDVTLSYVDTQSRKNAYVAEEARLLELMENATDLEYMLVLEDKLTEVRWQIESLESRLRTYDNQVDYSTVYLDVDEVRVYTEPEIIPETYGQKLAKSFTNSVKRVWKGLQNFLVWLVGAVPALVIWAIVIVILVFVVKAIIKKSNAKAEKKKAEKLAAQAQAQAQYYQALNQAQAENTQNAENNG